MRIFTGTIFFIAGVLTIFMFFYIHYAKTTRVERDYNLSTLFTLIIICLIYFALWMSCIVLGY